MKGFEFEIFRKYFKEIEYSENWEFGSDACLVPFWTYTGPSIKTLLEKANKKQLRKMDRLLSKYNASVSDYT